MSHKSYTSGQRIYFDLGESLPKGWATVEGHQGFVIIIKPEIPLKNYDYTHIYIVESQITVPPAEELN